MQNTTRNGDGKQSEWGQTSEPQQTTHLVSRTGELATTLLQPVATRQCSKSYQKSIPGSKVIIDTFGTQYSVITKGLSEMQIRRACEKAYLEAFSRMGIVLDQIYEPEFIVGFVNTVQKKATRIMESKRRRCARSSRQPKQDAIRWQQQYQQKIVQCTLVIKIKHILVVHAQFRG